MWMVDVSAETLTSTTTLTGCRVAFVGTTTRLPECGRADAVPLSVKTHRVDLSCRNCKQPAVRNYVQFHQGSDDSPPTVQQIKEPETMSTAVTRGLDHLGVVWRHMADYQAVTWRRMVGIDLFKPVLTLVNKMPGTRARASSPVPVGMMVSPVKVVVWLGDPLSASVILWAAEHGLSIRALTPYCLYRKM